MTTTIEETRAWAEGYAAGRRGVTASANPYPSGTAEAAEWIVGLSAGNKHGLRVVKGGRCD